MKAFFIQLPAAPGWLYTVSSGLMAAACLAIALLIGWYLRKKKDPPFTSVYALTGLLILACGVTILPDTYLSGPPARGFAAWWRGLTALTGWVVVAAIIRLMPRALALGASAELEQEIARRKQIEEQLYRNEQRFKSLVQEGGDLIGILDLQGHYLYVSPTVSLLGMTPGELSGQNALEFVHPDDGDRIKACFERVESEQRVPVEAFRFRDKQGAYRWIEAVLTNRLDDPAIGGIIVNSRDVTERIEKEEIIRQRTEEISKIFDYSRDIICAVDAAGRFVRVSNAALPTWGYSPEELMGRNYLSLVAEEDVAKTKAIARDIMTGRPATDFENRYVHKEGFPVPMLWSARWDEKDGLMYCIARNATEKIRLEKTLQNRQQRFARMFAEAPVSMCILRGPRHEFADANALYSRLTGRRREAILGKTVREVFPELEDQGYFHWLDEVYRTGQTHSGQETPLMVDLEGSGRRTQQYISFIYQPYYSNEGQIEGIYYFGIDVTEQVRARRLLEESEEKYRQIVELAREGIWVIDEHNTTTFVNQEMCDILGYSRTEMIGASLYAFMDASWQQVAEKETKERRDGKASQVEFVFRRRDGVPVWTNLSTAPIHSPDGTYRGAMAMVTDITARKQEEKVKETTARLHAFFSSESSLEGALRQSLEELCRLNEVRFADAWVATPDRQEFKLLTRVAPPGTGDGNTGPDTLKTTGDLPGKACAAGRAVYVPNLEEEPGFVRRAFARAHGLASALAIPLLFKGEVIAVLVFFRERAGAAFTAIDDSILFQLASETQRKKTEEELERFFTLSPDLLCIAGMDAYYKKVNPAFTKVLGYTEQELLTRTFLDLVHPDDRERTLEEIAGLSRGRDTFNFENRFLTKEGTLRHLVWTATPIPREGLIFALAKDVTDIKAAQLQAKTYSKRISVILESITDAFFTVDRHFVVTYWNRQAARLLGVEREKVQGRNLWEEFPEARTLRFYSEYHKALREGVSVRFEEYYPPIGMWLDISAYPSDEGLSVYFRDITESKKNYQALVKTETEVRHFARQLNTVLEEERSRIAREIHDEFGQQLAGIKMSLSSFLRRIPADEGSQARLGEIIEDVDATMQSLRSFATELRPGILDTMGLLPSLEWLAREFEKKTGITCYVGISAAEHDFEKAFATCYFRICQEALTNALKHAGAGHVALQVYQEAGALVLEVADDGTGIVEDKIQNPFSMGLLGMKERANIIGGTLRISRGVFGGTIVQLKAKIHAA